MTTANASPVTPSTGVPAGTSRVTPRTTAVRAEHRAGRARERPGLSQAADIQSELREAAAAAAEAADRVLVVAALLDEALAALSNARVVPLSLATSSPATVLGADLLSPREREVLALVARGRSNKAIADALYVSPNTVKTHVTSLLHKLQADSRVQLAAIATQHGLR